MRILLKDDIQTVCKFFQTVKMNKFYAAMSFLTSVTTHVMELASAFFISAVIQSIVNKHPEAAYMNILLGMLTGIASYASLYLNYLFFAKNSSFMYRTMRQTLTEKVMGYQSNFSEKKSTSMILNVMNEVADVTSITDNVTEVIVSFAKTIFLIYVFLKYNIFVGVVALVISLIYAGILDFANTKIVDLLRRQMKYKDKLTEYTRQVIDGVSEIRQFFAQDKILATTGDLLDRRGKVYLSRYKWVGLRQSCTPMIVIAGKTILYVILAAMAIAGKIEISVLVLLISYYEQIMKAMTKIMDYSRSIREKAVSVERIYSLLNYTGVDNIAFGDEGVDDIDGVVRFIGVNFKYDDKIGGSVEDINFVAEAGKITAIVGRSGSGKTTLANLLMRKYRVDSGEILVDNVNILNYSKEIFAKNVSLIDQTPFLFNSSIRNNLGIVDGNTKRQMEACKRVGLHNTIMKLPSGYNTVIGNKNKRLNLGQIQLLAIARALLTKAEILVLDEATSPIDPVMTKEIKNLILNLKTDHTIILVTHDKELMKMADKVVVMNDGRVLDTGSHKELMKRCKYYVGLQNNSYYEDKGMEDLDDGELEKEVIE